jgi:ribonuclease P protein component
VKRAGFALSRQLRGAVRRNRARRRVREAYRLSRDLLREGTQVVFVVRSGALTVEFSELLIEVQQGLQAASSRGNKAT